MYNENLYFRVGLRLSIFGVYFNNELKKLLLIVFTSSDYFKVPNKGMVMTSKKVSNGEKIQFSVNSTST